jgi:hypothetical protein
LKFDEPKAWAPSGSTPSLLIGPEGKVAERDEAKRDEEETR